MIFEAGICFTKKILSFLAERPGSGYGERDASMTRQMPYEPLPAPFNVRHLVFAVGVHGFIEISANYLGSEVPLRRSQCNL